MQKLLKVEGINEPTAWACASTTFIFKFLLTTSQPFSSSFYNFYIFGWYETELSLSYH